MKKFILLIVCMLTVSIIPCTSVVAAVIDNVTYNSVTGEINVSGTLGSFETKQVVEIYLLADSVSKQDISNLTFETNPMDIFKNIGMTTVDTNGNYAYSFIAKDANPTNLLFVKSKDTEMIIPLAEYTSIAAEIFVAPDGHDNATGDINNPLGSFEGAKNRVQVLRESLGSKSEIIVYFRGGEYRMTDTVKFDEADSGTLEGRVIYQAYLNEKPVFKGSQKLDLNLLNTINDISIIKRLPISSSNKVLQMDLGAQGITQEQSVFKSFSDERDVENYQISPTVLGLYLNGQRQNIARWPNYGYNDFSLSNGTNAIVNDGSSGNGATFKYDAMNPTRWVTAKHMYVDGYLETQYSGCWQPIEKIDTDSKQIKLARGIIKNDIKWESYKYRRWTAVNLLEEIDMPGEFFIDKDTMIMYYYPSYELNKDTDILEYATMQNKFIQVSRVSNLTFKGLTFTQSYGGGIIGNDVSNITIDGCEMSYLRGVGVNLAYASDITINNNTVHNVSGDGINIYSDYKGNNMNHLIYCNNNLINNHVYNVGAETRGMRSGISAAGIGTNIKNNLVHLSPNMALSGGAPETTISHNEIYNLIRDTADAGGIYNGRIWTIYGVVYEYNYIHDLGIEGFLENEHTSGIFWDDFFSGQTARNNIIVNNYIGRDYGINMNGGRDLEVTNNVFAGFNYALRNTDRSNDVNFFDNENNLTMLADLKTVVKSNSIYSNKYPQMAKNYNEITNPLDPLYDRGTFIPRNNHFTENVFASLKSNISSPAVGIEINGRMLKDPSVIIAPNYVSVDNSIFIDSKKQDYRVSEAGKVQLGMTNNSGFKLDERFNLEAIGLQNNEDLKLKNSVILGSPFNKTYPKNNEIRTKATSIQLAWEQGLFADEYEYTVSKNMDLSNPIKMGSTINKFVDITGLDSNTTYYWNVIAKHTSRKYSQAEYNNGRWDSEGGVYSFKTSPNELFINDIIITPKEIGYIMQMNIDNSGLVKNPTVILAQYNKNDILKQIITTPITVPAYLLNQTISVDFQADITDNDYFVAFIWDNFGNIIPMANNKIYPR